VGSVEDRRGADGGGRGGRPSRAALHPRRAHRQDLRLLLEPQRALGHLLRLRGQHHAGPYLLLVKNIHIVFN
jgi:hypothetical protein